MRRLTRIILPEVGVGDLKIRPRGDNRCESAKYHKSVELFSSELQLRHHKTLSNSTTVDCEPSIIGKSVDEVLSHNLPAGIWPVKVVALTYARGTGRI